LLEKDGIEIKNQNDSWQIFKIMSEFVEGFESFLLLALCVTIFGSAGTHPSHKYYKMAEDNCL